LRERLGKDVEDAGLGFTLHRWNSALNALFIEVI
jgi:hypothetical protein